MVKKISKNKAKKNKSRAVSLAMVLAISLYGSNPALAGMTTSLATSSIASSSSIGGGIIPGSYDIDTKTWLVNFSGGSGGIINWSSLGIDTGQRLQFNFTAASGTAAVLNRVTGGDLSVIAGTIGSDGGKVFLVNPTGIIFNGATINAPLFVASTLAVTDDAFRNYATGASSSLPFSGGTNSIQVDGPVDAGHIALIAPTITVAPGVSISDNAVVRTSSAFVDSEGIVTVPTPPPTTMPPTTMAPTTIAPTPVPTPPPPPPRTHRGTDGGTHGSAHCRSCARSSHASATVNHINIGFGLQLAARRFVGRLQRQCPANGGSD